MTLSSEQPRLRDAFRTQLLSTPLGWTSLALAGGILLHIDRAPLWVWVSAFALIVWRLAAASVRTVRLPGKITRALIAFAFVGAVFVGFHTLNGLIAGTWLLLLMCTVKLLETHARRDQYIVVGGTLFLLLAACLERQNLLRTPLYVLEMWLCCATFAIIGYSPDTSAGEAATRQPENRVGWRGALEGSSAFDTRAAFLLSGRALLYSLPLAVILFLVFPRLPGAFWALPRSEDAETGLSDKMSPGSISQLTSSYDIAFRAKFQGAPPPPSERYWRGPVLHKFDGYTWSREFDDAYRAQPLQYLGPAYRYRISLEPSQQRWWLTLDTATGSPDQRVAFTYDYELIANDPVTSLTTYDAVSHTQTRPTTPLSRLARHNETELPAGRNTRSIELARDMRSRSGSDRAFVGAVLEYLRTGGFVYSLTPPLLDYNSVDDFIFNTRSGFCGHYASAFVTLMRAADVPARVVTGYLGGEWNPIGEYFIVRQSDAHSWAEVWLEGRGWTRVDPTVVVEPERLTRGMLDLLPGAGSTETRLVRASPTLVELLHRWDALNTWWNDHVLKFDYRSQLRLLSRLGFRSPNAAMLGRAFVLALLAWLGWIAWHFGRGSPQRRPDRLARAYARLCRKLARIGMPRPPYLGPIAYADAVGERRPDIAAGVRSLLTRYAELRYGPPGGDSQGSGAAGFEREVASFERDVARLSLAKAP
jgi:protein-glutamine gamma-glutamyltransferase